jgi:exosortase
MVELAASRGFAPIRADGRWFALAGLAAMAGPTLVSLAQQSWSTEAGAHGPIVLATGLWLFWRRWDELSRDGKPGRPLIAGALFLTMLPLYVFGRAYDFLFIEAGALFSAFAALCYGRFGLAMTRRHWFLLLYLAFLVPVPGWAMDQATQPLKEFVSAASADLMRGAGVPVFREGVTLYIAQYQLLVEDACAGMNSLMGLISISLFYIYVRRGAEWRYALLLVCLIVPVAVLANMVRISVLVLLTWGWGDAVAQGFLHFTAGFLLFALALLLIFGIDAVLGRLLGLRETQL